MCGSFLYALKLDFIGIVIRHTISVNNNASFNQREERLRKNERKNQKGKTDL